MWICVRRYVIEHIESVAEINELCNLIHMMVKVHFFSTSSSNKISSWNEIVTHTFPLTCMNILRKNCEKRIMKISNMILKLVSESITIEITKRKIMIMARPWHKTTLLFAWISCCKNDLRKYIDKYMLLNVDCSSQNDPWGRNISLFDNRVFTPF